LPNLSTHLRLTRDRATRLVRRHPRRFTSIVLGLLAGTCATAFGIAPLAPDAADLPRRVVTQSVDAPQLDAQLQALETYGVELWRSDLTRASDTADSLLRRIGLDDPEAAAFLRSDPLARHVLEGRPGKMTQAIAEGGKLKQLIVRSPAERSEQLATHFTRLSIERGEHGLVAKTEQAPLTSEVKMGSGTIQSSLFAAADEARLPDTVTMQMAELFSADIDFRRELRRGDSFTVLYETLTADGEPITWNQAAGRILAARFENDGNTYDAVWFQEPGQRGGYFGLDGRSKRRSFLASPLAFTRVSSGFSMRFHPIMQKWRQHLGVDYAAPTGTAVRAVGDGVVDFAGWQNGYGNVVILKHAGDRETRYAHLSRIDVRRGQRVDQSQSIGVVGATGWATGPHLHFEFRVRGQVQDPMSIARSSESITISPEAKARFGEVSKAVRTQLAYVPAPGGARFE